MRPCTCFAAYGCKRHALAARALLTSQCGTQTQHYRKLLFLLCIAFVAQLAATFGVVAGVVLYTRQSVVPRGTAALTTVDGTQVIQTASFAQSSTMSSALPDDAFQQLKLMTVNAPSGSWVQLFVLGTARIQGSGQLGSVVRILTHAGTITIDGRDMTFSESASPVFEDAGFVVAPNRRRLLDAGTSLVGFFNYMASFDLDALERAAGAATPSSFSSFEGFPSSYSMTAAIYTPCNVRDMRICLTHRAALYCSPPPCLTRSYGYAHSSPTQRQAMTAGAVALMPQLRRRSITTFRVLLFSESVPP